VGEEEKEGRAGGRRERRRTSDRERERISGLGMRKREKNVR